MDSCLLPTVYWGSVQYYSKIFGKHKIFIEQFETYPKQTYRNRCIIYSPNGALPLMVPVERGSFHKILTKDIQISYDTLWIKNHLKAIESAYRSSPYYEFFLDDILLIYQNKPKYLLDLNTDIFKTTMKWLRWNPEIEYTSSFICETEMPDYRNLMHPKAAKNLVDAGFFPEPYIQGFEQRFGFIPNLSILDLVFNTGGDARKIIEASIK